MKVRILKLTSPLSLLAVALFSIGTAGDLEAQDISLETVALDRPISFMAVSVPWSDQISQQEGLLSLDPMTRESRFVAFDDGMVSNLPIDGDSRFTMARDGNQLIAFGGTPFGGNFQAQFLDPRLEELGKIDFSKVSLEKATPAAVKPLSLFDFTVASGQIFAYGTVSTPGFGLIHGFFTYPLTSKRNDFAARGELLTSVGRAQNEYFTLGFDYIDSAGSDIYFLKMTDQPELFHYSLRTASAPTPLGYFPAGDEPLPGVNSGARTLGEALDGLAEFDGFPFGLYVHEGHLLCLKRGRNEQDELVWQIDKIETDLENATAKVVDTFSLDELDSEVLRAVSTDDGLALLGADLASLQVSEMVIAKLP